MFEKERNGLKIVFWKVTSECNLRCRHCRNDFPEKYRERELSVTEINNTIDKLLKFSRPLIALSGGEPTLRKDIFDIINYISIKKLQVSLVTNGTLLTRDFIKKIKSSGITSVAISIDGKDSKTHDKIRGVPGSFNRALEAMAYLKEMGVLLQINTTITPHNFTQIKEIVNLSEKQGAKAMHVFFLIPIGCAKNVADNNRITPKQCEEVLNYICDYSIKSGLPIRPICAPFYLRILKQNSESRKNFHTKYFTAITKGCLAAKEILFISSSGEVYPCGYMPISAGNIRKDDIESIWKNSELFNNLRHLENLKGKCLKCEFKFNCGGGCRARAYAQAGDYLEEDPYCLYSAQTYKPDAR